jgi:hypothetical protein
MKRRLRARSRPAGATRLKKRRKYAWHLGISCLAKLPPPALQTVGNWLWNDGNEAAADATMFGNRFLAAAIAGLAAGLVGPTIASHGQPGEAAITCTNPASGASWQIMIDYRKATVDANPAVITSAEIAWFDPRDGGNYRLDRHSGNFKASIASSTGGYFRRGRCTLDQSR